MSAGIIARFVVFIAVFLAAIYAIRRARRWIDRG